MNLQRVPFFFIFQENSDGSLSPKYVIRVGGVTFGPGVAFGPGVVFGGINFFDIKGRELAVEKLADGSYEIKGYYNA